MVGGRADYRDGQLFFERKSRLVELTPSTRAMLAIAKEPTIAAAAHAPDFAGAAHLTRTFDQMFGIPPSVMMRGEFFQIALPFSTPR